MNLTGAFFSKNQGIFFLIMCLYISYDLYMSYDYILPIDE